MIPGSANFGGMNEAQRNAIVQALLARTNNTDAPDPAFAQEEPYQYPVDPSDPASEGLEGDAPGGPTSQGLSAMGLGAIVGGPFASSVAQQGYSDTIGGMNNPGGRGAPGTGLGMVAQGYGSSLGYSHAANMADQAMTALGIYDAIDTSHDVNAAVEEGGYTSPSPAPAPAYESPDPSSTIVGLPSDFTTSNVSMDASDAATGGFGTGTGFSSANAANDAVAGALADAGMAAGLTGLGDSTGDAAAGFDAGVTAGYDAGGNTAAGFDAGGSGEGGGGGAGGGSGK